MKYKGYEIARSGRSYIIKSSANGACVGKSFIRQCFAVNYIDELTDTPPASVSKCLLPPNI